jgi:hypothetical protein
MKRHNYVGPESPESNRLAGFAIAQRCLFLFFSPPT